MPWIEMSENDPGRVDQAVRTAIHLCWHALPVEKQNLDEVERIFRRLVDRTFNDLREDAELFGVDDMFEEPLPDDL